MNFASTRTSTDYSCSCRSSAQPFGCTWLSCCSPTCSLGGGGGFSFLPFLLMRAMAPEATDACVSVSCFVPPPKRRRAGCDSCTLYSCSAPSPALAGARNTPQRLVLITTGTGIGWIGGHKERQIVGERGWSVFPPL